jgi:hypothetical protein
MSVDDPRLAAAQRTAARNWRRARLCATWLFIVPLLAMFSFSVVAGAKTFGKEDVGRAVRQLPDDRHVVEVPVSKGDRGGDGHGDQGDGGNLTDRFSHSEHYVCSVNSTQLAKIQTRYRTGRSTLRVDGRSLDIVAVYDANERDLRDYLGNVSCVLVKVSHTFFLPFDAHTS